MAWLEITIDTASREVEAVAQGLTARGFSDLVIEDEQEFEEFLERTGPIGTISMSTCSSSFRDCPGSSSIWRIPTRLP